MNVESYRPVVDFPDYEVRSDGSIRSQKNSINWKILKGSVDPQTGYIRVSLRKDGKTYKRYVHHVVLENFIGPRPEGMECCHGDGIRTNNDILNLRWDTPVGNNADRILHGTSNRGSRQGRSKLKESDVVRIFEIRRANPKATAKEIGGILGVKRNTVYSILWGDNWKWLTKDFPEFKTSNKEVAVQWAVLLQTHRD